MNANIHANPEDRGLYLLLVGIPLVYGNLKAQKTADE